MASDTASVHSKAVAERSEVTTVPSQTVMVPSNVAVPSEKAAVIRLTDGLLAEGVPVRPIGHYMDAEHTFSHIQWKMSVYRCVWQEEPESLSGLQAAESAAAYEAGRRTIFAGSMPAIWSDTPFRTCSSASLLPISPRWMVPVRDRG